VQPLPPPVAVAALPEPQQATPAAPPAPAASAPAAAPAGAGSDEGTAHGGRGRGDEGAGLAAVGNGSPNATADDYLEKVKLWILRFRKPPDGDCKTHEGMFDITIARDGTLLDVSLEKSSGCLEGDKAALQMARDASPVPPIPPYLNHSPMVVGIPFGLEPGGFLNRLFR
jgi:TonB family protein